MNCLECGAPLKDALTTRRDSMDLTVTQLAEIFLKAQDIRESSWNGGGYTYYYDQAAKKALEGYKVRNPEVIISLITMLMRNLWNDMAIVAEELIKERD